jgi:hypothetical protein
VSLSPFHSPCMWQGGEDVHARRNIGGQMGCNGSPTVVFLLVEPRQWFAPDDSGGQSGSINDLRFQKARALKAGAVELQEPGRGDGIEAKIGQVGTLGDRLEGAPAGGVHHLYVGTSPELDLGHACGKGPGAILAHCLRATSRACRAGQEDRIVRSSQPGRIGPEGDSPPIIAPGQIAGSRRRNGECRAEAGAVHRPGESECDGLSEFHQNRPGGQLDIEQECLCGKGPLSIVGQGSTASVEDIGFECDVVTRDTNQASLWFQHQDVLFPGEPSFQDGGDDKASLDRSFVHGPGERDANGAIQGDTRGIWCGRGQAQYVRCVEGARHPSGKLKAQFIEDPFLEGHLVAGCWLEWVVGLKNKGGATVLPCDLAGHC